MSELTQHRLRWRGSILGPHPWPKIERMLADREIGIWHEIELDGRWESLEDVLARRRPSGPIQVTLPSVAGEPLRLQPSATDSSSSLSASNALARGVANDPTSGAKTAESGSRSREGASGARKRRPRLVLFALLGIILGPVGAHNFYSGYWIKGVAQMAATAAAVYFHFGFIVVWFWAALEVLLIRDDVHGRPMR